MPALLLLSAVALSGCSASSGDSSAPGTVTVLGFPNQVQDLLLTVGQDEGFFGKAGITVDTADYPTSLEPGQAVKATKSDVLQMTAGAAISHATYFLQSSFTPNGRTLLFVSKNRLSSANSSRSSPIIEGL